MNTLVSLCFVTLAATLFQSGAARECYECQAIKSDDKCNDPFENNNYQKTCSAAQDVCFKMTVEAGDVSLVTRSCATSSQVKQICSVAQAASSDVECLQCDGDLCNTSSRHKITAALMILPSCLLVWKFFSTA